MLSSLTNKLRTLFAPESNEIDICIPSTSRKRKRAVENSLSADLDDDVIIVSSKRPKLAPEGTHSGFLTNFWSPTAMSDWVKRKKKSWNNSFFFRSLSKDNNAADQHRQAEAPLVNGRVRLTQQPSRSPLLSSVKTQTDYNATAQQGTPRQNAFVLNGVDEESLDSVETSSLNRTSLFGSTCSKNPSFTVNQCVRLDEKERYRQLLQHFTTVSLDRTKTVSSNRWPAVSQSRGSSPLPQPTLLGSYMPKDLLGTAKKKPIVHSKKVIPAESVHYEAVPVPRSPSPTVETTQLPYHHHETELSIIVGEPAESHLEIAEKKKRDYRSKDSSHKFKQSEHLNEDWINDMRNKYSASVRERQRKIAEEEIKTKIYKERRKEKENDLEKRIRERMVLYEKEPAVLEEQVEEEEKEKVSEFPELSSEMNRLIDSALRPHPPDEVVSEGFKLQITRRDIATLSKLNWLNDEIINFYMNMLMARGDLDNFPKVYAFNTFFCPKITKDGHSSVRRWTRRVDIFSYDYLLIPVHLGMHWCLAVVDFRKKFITYYDSMGGRNMQCLNAIRKYLCDEMMDKKKTTFNTEAWKLEIAQDIPQQMNGSDCGMFACKYAEYITRGAKITFTQKNMPYFRRRMVHEIATKILL